MYRVHCILDTPSFECSRAGTRAGATDAFAASDEGADGRLHALPGGGCGLAGGHARPG